MIWISSPTRLCFELWAQRWHWVLHKYRFRSFFHFISILRLPSLIFGFILLVPHNLSSCRINCDCCRRGWFWPWSGSWTWNISRYIISSFFQSTLHFLQTHVIFVGTHRDKPILDIFLLLSPLLGRSFLGMVRRCRFCLFQRKTTFLENCARRSGQFSFATSSLDLNLRPWNFGH